MEWAGRKRFIKGSNPSVKFRSVEDNEHSGDRISERVYIICKDRLHVNRSSDGALRDIHARNDI